MVCSIIVASHNGSRTIGRLFESLLSMDRPRVHEVELVFVDSASTDNTLDIIKSAKIPFPKKVIGVSEQGHSHALNQGIKNACGELLIFTDDDCFVDREWLAAYVNAVMLNKEGTFFFGPIKATYEVTPPTWWTIMPRSLSGRNQGEVYKIYRTYSRDAYPIGCNMAVRRSAVVNYGIFDERLGPKPQSRLGFGADTELGARLIKHGGSGVWVPNACVTHFVPRERLSWRYAKQRAITDGKCSVYYRNQYAKHSKPNGFLCWIALISKGITEIIRGLLSSSETLIRKGCLKLLKAVGWILESAQQLVEPRFISSTRSPSVYRVHTFEPGRTGVVCPPCGWQGDRFLTHRGRVDARCPKCESLERHRHQSLLLKTTNLGSHLRNGRVLLVGPRKHEHLMLSDANQLVTCDSRSDIGDICCRLENLPFETGAFNVIWISHVLEHIPQVMVALRESYRVLAHLGVALFDVPIYGQVTKKLDFPDHQGHHWHPGRDWFELYRSVGFTVNLHEPTKHAPRFRLLSSNTVAVCQKPSQSMLIKRAEESV